MKDKDVDISDIIEPVLGFKDCVKFKRNIMIKAGKRKYIILYDTINDIVDIREVVGFAGGKPIFKGFIVMDGVNNEL